MSLIASAISVVERAPLPDSVLRMGVGYLVGRTRERLGAAPPAAAEAFARDMTNYPIAIHTREANAQHYEVPARFFELALGPRRKYSCCYYDSPETTLAQAELRALEETALHAGLADGQTILELGCGWGSLSLFMAQKYLNARITAVSNSASQRAFIKAQATRLGLDQSAGDHGRHERFRRDGAFRPHRLDRDVRAHVELAAAARAAARLARPRRQPLHPHLHPPQSALPLRSRGEGGLDRAAFLHRRHHAEPPAHSQLRRSFRRRSRNGCGTARITSAPRWTGCAISTRVARRSTRCCARPTAPTPPLWRRRWRLFFLATEGLFGDSNGEEWGVSHYRLRPVNG